MDKRRMNQRLRRRTDLDKGLLDKGWHSKAYHRHFEGYAEVETTNEKGKTVIERVYVGDYYRLDLPKSKRVQLRLFYAGLIALVAALFGFAASRSVGANMTWYLAIPQMIGVCLIGLLCNNIVCSSCEAFTDDTSGITHREKKNKVDVYSAKLGLTILVSLVTQVGNKSNKVFVQCLV